MARFALALKKVVALAPWWTFGLTVFGLILAWLLLLWMGLTYVYPLRRKSASFP